MDVAGLFGLTVLLAYIETGLSIKCYNCLYMEVKGGNGAKYGDSACKKDGLEYMEAKDVGGWVCTRSEKLQPYRVYASRAVHWGQILAPNQAQNYGDWSCQKSSFTLQSKASKVEVDVWYRGCQPISDPQNCGDDVTSNIRDIVVFKEIYANITSTALSKVTVKGEECLCKYYMCNAGQSPVVNWVVMVTALVAILFCGRYA